MTRDMKKTAEKATREIPSNYDLNSSEIIDLMKKARKGSPDDTYNAIITAFKYGFVLGHRATVAGKITKRI